MFCCLKLRQRSWEIMRLRMVCLSLKHGMNFVLRKWEPWYSNCAILMVAINGFHKCCASTNTWPCNEVSALSKYRGADKSLARPGRKQANVSVRMAWISFGALPCRKKKNLVTARVSMLLKLRASLTCFRACFFPGRAKDLSAPRYLFLSVVLLRKRKQWKKMSSKVELMYVCINCRSHCICSYERL